MMTEKDLIAKLKDLREITPQKEWVSLTKTEILGSESTGFSFFPNFNLNLKPALAGFIAVFAFAGFFGYTAIENSLPGDFLFAVKKVVHQGEAIFVSDNNKPAYQLRVANDRLQDLVKAPSKNLAPAINEFQASITEAAKGLAQVDATTSPMAIREIVEQTKKLEANRQKVEALGVVLNGTQELDDALARIVGNLISDLENRTLNETQASVLAGMQGLSSQGKYSEALELYLTNQ